MFKNTTYAEKDFSLAVKPPLVQRIVEVCLLVGINASIIVGNLLVCVAVYKNPNLRTITNIHIFSLALTDLLMSTTVVPLYTQDVATENPSGYLVCTIRTVCGYYAACVSLHTMGLIAVNRYFKVVKPLLHRKIYGVKNTVLICVSPWITAMVSIVIILGFFDMQIGYSHIPVEVDNKKYIVICSADAVSTSSSVFLLVLVFVYVILPSIIMPVCYVCVFRKLRQHNNRVAPSLHTGSLQSVSNSVEEVKVTKTVVAVVVGFYVCWVPASVITVVYTIFYARSSLRTVPFSAWRYSTFYSNIPVYVSSAINPVIYSGSSSAFRKAFHGIVHCK